MDENDIIFTRGVSRKGKEACGKVFESNGGLGFVCETIKKKLGLKDSPPHNPTCKVNPPPQSLLLFFFFVIIIIII